ncbi:hypothetical protein NCS52_01221200 [Fusarium sp. LHS14.1]|nr:hypothetical protein NCS52_01221200 [Fusarium sp. LHS14.1]
MSADNSSRLDEPAERMTLLGQRKRDTSPAALDATVALARQGDFVSHRLEVLISKCQTDGEIDRELWDDLEIHRRSANTYIDQYLDSLQQVHEGRRNVYEVEDVHDEAFPTDLAVRSPDSGVSSMTRVEWRLKISSDSLVRDLLAMRETLEFLKRRIPEPSKRSLSIGALSVSASIVVIMWSDWYPVEALGLLTMNMASLAVYYSSPVMLGWLRTESIERYQGKVEALLRRLKKNELDEENREGLSGMWCWMVEQFRK